MRELWVVVKRQTILYALFFLPRKRRIAIERYLRGKEEYRRLQKSDWVLVSWGKSGRTWFRVMLSRFYQIKHGLPEHSLLEFDNLHNKDSAIPRVLFSHNNYLRDYLKNRETLDYFNGKKIVLMVRDPRDVAVSQFFQWKYRMRPHKKRLNKYPQHGADISTYDFVMNETSGAPRIAKFLNLWAKEKSAHGDVLIVRYEDMRKNPQDTLKNVLDFVGTPGSDQQISEAVEFSSMENMKKMEEKRTFWRSGSRIRPGDKQNPNSYKVRRGKVGGFRDYFDDDQVNEINKVITSLDPVYGYRAFDE